MLLHEITLSGDVQGSLLIPELRGDLGVVVVAGSSGRVDIARAKLFASHGAVALALRWFGGDGQTPGICEMPIETFIQAIDRLVDEGCDRITFVGMSKGAEAALLPAIHDSRVDFVIAISPTSVVLGNVGPGRGGEVWPQRSSWTYRNVPVPFIARDRNWSKVFRDVFISYQILYERSLLRFASEVESATIPVERTDAEIVLVAGRDDALWPSDVFARSIAARLAAVGRRAWLIFEPEAGHRVLLQGETAPRSGLRAHGGHDAADAALGQAAWNAMADLCKWATSTDNA